MNIFVYYFILIFYTSHLITSIEIKNINENSQLKIQLKHNFYFSANIYINEKEYNLPIDINSDRTWINKYNNIDNKNIDKIFLEECKLFEIDIKRKKNIPISFFDKDILLDEIAYEEINYNFNNNSCETKNGVIGLSKKSEKKIFNLLTQLNKVYSLKKSFSIFNNELIIGNFNNSLTQNKYISTPLIDSEYGWAFNLQGIYFGEIDKNNYKDDYFIINKMNSNYIKSNTVFAFDSLQKYIIVDYYFFDFIYENIFKRKCNIKRNDVEGFEGIYCDKNTIEKMPLQLSFMISDKLLHLPLNNLFIKISDDEYLFIIIYTDYVWGKLNTIGNLFYNELGNKIIFDAESNHIYFMSDQIIEKVKIIDEYSIDEKQIILNNYTFSKYDAILCIVLILNFFGIFMLLGSIYKEKIINQLPKNIKQIKNMNK